MIDDALLSKFDEIKDLPVSEEILGSYLEGSLSPDEAIICEDAMAQNPFLGDICKDIMVKFDNHDFVD